MILTIIEQFGETLMKQSVILLTLISLSISACSPSLALPSPQGNNELTATRIQSKATLTQQIATTEPVSLTLNPTSTPVTLATKARQLTPTTEITLRPTFPGEEKFLKLAWYRGNSPDLKWFWTVEEEPPMAIEYFVTHLVNAEGSVEWFIHPEAGKTGWDGATYLPTFWLPKEPFVYLRGYGCCADGPRTHYGDKSFVRFNLETGQLSTILPWKNGLGAYATDFSPTGKYLLWSTGGEHSIHIIQLSNGNEKIVHLPEKYRDIGGFRNELDNGWSPNGKRVIQEIYMDCEAESDFFCYRVAFVIIEPGTGGYQIIENELTQTIGENDLLDYQIYWVDDDNIHLSVGTNEILQKVNIPETTP